MNSWVLAPACQAPQSRPSPNLSDPPHPNATQVARKFAPVTAERLQGQRFRGHSGADPISASVATLSELLGLAPKAGAGSLTKEQARAGHWGAARWLYRFRALKMRILPPIHFAVPTLRPGTVGAYALAFVSVGVATALRVAIDPYVVGVQYITFAPAIMITTLIAGSGAGLFCVVLSAAAAWFFVLPPHLSFYTDRPAELLALLLFALVAFFLVILTTRMRFAVERERAEQAVRASKDRLQLALDAARLGSWQYDPLRRASSGDARANEIFDFDIAEKEVVLEEILRRVHPDDVERVRAAVATALDPVDPKPFAIEYRVRRGDGKVRWVENHGLAYFEGAGPERQVVSFVGTAQDITERKEHEEREHLLMREINHRA